MFTLSAALPSDLDEVLRLVRRCNLLEEGVREALPALVVARADTQLVACGALETYAKHGLLRSLAVEPEHRGRGAGAAVVRELVHRAARNGLSALYLLTTTAQNYFERFGFADCERRAAPAGIAGSWEFRSGCPTSATLMVHRLD